MKIRFLKIMIPVFGFAVISLSTQAVARTMIKNTRHNLSSWGQYNIKAQSENQVCIFCHTPHNADSTQAPLWNHKDTTEPFGVASTQYVRPTGGLATVDTSLNYISKKCMSCHDGTVAIGATVRSGNIQMAPHSDVDFNADSDGRITGKLATSSRGYIQPNSSAPQSTYDVNNSLSKGHVISFVYDNTLVSNLNSAYGDNRYKNMSSQYRASMLDKSGKMHCHTCHDPHNDWCNDSNKTIGKDPLWRLSCDGSGKNVSVCEKCHNQTYDYYTAPKYPF